MGTKSDSFMQIEPKLNRLQEEVLTKLKTLREASCEQIAQEFGKFPHEITPRLKELRDMGKVHIVGTTVARSGKRVNLYAAKLGKYDNPSQPTLWGM